MTAFTAEQRAAIERREGDLLLSANAGSGKTRVLVERFVRCVLEDGLRPAQILAITFTEKAAGELRARIRRRFVELGRRDEAQEAEGAWVSTIHGLCARVLRAHAVSAGLDPAFEVLDEPAARALRAEAFDAALAAFLDDDAVPPRFDALDLAAAYTPDRLQAMVLGAYDELRSLGQARPTLPPVAAPDVAGARAALLRAARAAAGELDAAGPGKAVDEARAALAACLEGAAAHEPGAPLGRWALSKRAAALRTPICDAYRAALSAYEQACVDARAVPALPLVDELLEGFGAAYDAAKARRSGLDFSDLELRARDLFAAAPAVAEAYATRFARIMVDEFQDTNRLQLELLRALGRDQVFVVGDELQSIYGFRHADVRIMRERRSALAARDRAAELATNFRSRPELLAAVNAAYGDLHAGYVALEPGRSMAPAGEPVLELLVTDQPGWDDGAPEDTAAAVRGTLPAPRTSSAAEARLVARRVRELVDTGSCRPSEVVVLLRAVANMGLFERALEDEGLATLASGGRGWWGRQQVQDLLAYLGALVNPRDELALFGLLASPLVGISSDGLALLVLGAAERGWSRWDALEAAFCPGGPGPEGLTARLGARDAERLLAFCPRFQAERREAPRLGLAELLERVVAASGYDVHVLGLPGGRRRLANVHKLMRLAAAFEARHGRDVRGFIDHAQAEVQADAPEPDAPVDLGDDEAVRLMTIHAAKGLEFGVVVLADLGRQGATQFPDLLVRGDRVGLRLIGLDGTNAKALDYEAIRDALREDEIAEERRVMHVALTRAEDRLILSGCACPGDGWAKPGHGAPPMSWLAPRLVPGVEHALDPALPVTERASAAGAEVPVRVAFSTPASAAALLPRVGAAGEQLALALEPAPAALPVAAPAAAPAPAPAVPAPPVPAAVSYSALGRYAACPYRFYLERTLRLPEQPVPPHLAEAAAPAPGLEARLRGTLVHELLERHEGAGEADVRALAEQHEAELSDDDVADLLEMLRAFEGSALRRRLAAAIDVRREHGFAFLLHDGGPLVNGIVDVLAHEPDGTVLVVDYKSDRLEGALPEAVVAASYATQRELYALAALRGGAPSVEVAHVFLERPDEPAAARFTPADVASLEWALRAQARGLLAAEFPVAATPHRGLCATCPGRGGLCSWPTELTDRTPAEAAAGGAGV